MRTFEIDAGLNHGGAGLPAPGRSIALTSRISAPGFVMGFSRNEEIYGEEEPADFVYRVVSGVVRTVRVLTDGRRQIEGFHMAGDVFGLEPGDVHGACAEAITDCQIGLIRRAALERAADQDSHAARELWTITAHDLERLRAHVQLLCRRGAVERVAAFLAEMAARVGGDTGVDLPMSRLDIADYLGLTIETVSRSLTLLERDGVIGLPSARRVDFRDTVALAACQG